MNPKSRFRVPFMTCLTLWLLAGSAYPEDFSVGNYEVVSSRRFGQAEFEYVVHGTVTNNLRARSGGCAAALVSAAASMKSVGLCKEKRAIGQLVYK